MGGCATKPKDLNLSMEKLPAQSSPERPPTAVEDDPASDKVSDQKIRGDENTGDDAKGQKDPPLNASEAEQEIPNSGGETKEGLDVSRKDEPNLIDLNDPATDLADGKKVEVDSAKVSNIINGEVETKNQIKDKPDEAAKIVKNSETKEKEAETKKSDVPQQPLNSESSEKRDLPLTGDKNNPTSLVSA